MHAGFSHKPITQKKIKKSFKAIQGRTKKEKNNISSSVVVIHELKKD